MNKKSVIKAKARLKKAKVKLAVFQRRARKEMARVAVQLKRHQRAAMLAAKRYKNALKSA